MRTFSIVALGAMALSGGAAQANSSAPNPTLAPLTYATPERGWFSLPNPIGKPAVETQVAQAYKTERAQLLRKYLALEEANGGVLSPENLAAMRSDIADLKRRYSID